MASDKIKRLQPDLVRKNYKENDIRLDARNRFQELSVQIGEVAVAGFVPRFEKFNTVSQPF
jgi:hypothetical protein